MERFERVIILVSEMALVQAGWKLHRSKVKGWWTGVKDRLPRHWRPKSPDDCPKCRLEAAIEKAPEPCERPIPYAVSKRVRGRKKQLNMEGWACPNTSCKYYGETDASRHAVIGHGKLGKDKTIQRLKCAACVTTFSSRKGTPLYYIKTEPEMIAEVLWWLAEGVDVSVLVRRFGYEEKTLAQWLMRAGEHGQRLHVARFRDLNFALIQMDELYAKVKDEEKARWLWLAIDPVSKALPALHLGSRRAEDAYALVHELKRRLHPACVPSFTTDGLRAYFHAITAHASPKGSLAGARGAAARAVGQAQSASHGDVHYHTNVVGQTP